MSKTKTTADYIEAIYEALQHLQFATPRERNGPCIQATNKLRMVLGADPVEPGQLAMEGIPMFNDLVCPDCGATTSCYSCATQGGWRSQADEEKYEREQAQEISP